MASRRLSLGQPTQPILVKSNSSEDTSEDLDDSAVISEWRVYNSLRGASKTLYSFLHREKQAGGRQNRATEESAELTYYKRKCEDLEIENDALKRQREILKEALQTSYDREFDLETELDACKSLLSGMHNTLSKYKRSSASLEREASTRPLKKPLLERHMTRETPPPQPKPETEPGTSPTRSVRFKTVHPKSAARIRYDSTQRPHSTGMERTRAGDKGKAKENDKARATSLPQPLSPPRSSVTTATEMRSPSEQYTSRRHPPPPKWHSKEERLKARTSST
ncbi:hypothetical protein FRB99_005544 [Tulasnella sp. 403]|nr:hypothetical protein FRB99_005544 [Tulasnella sp. 403]